MAKVKGDKKRENRIDMEILVDAYDEEERAMGWFYYLQDKIQFPFKAKCIAKRNISPLIIGEQIIVEDMGDEDDCMNEMFVKIKLQGRKLSVPLSQLKPINADKNTKEAVEDWRYWAACGYEM